MVFQQIKVILLSILGIFRRALCCFSRRRRVSLQQQYVQSSAISPEMIQVVVDMEGNSSKAQSYSSQRQGTERDWNSWDDSPRTVEEHIEQYRQRMTKPPTPDQQQAEPDYFSGLAPTIKPQPKYFLGETQERTDFSRLEAKTDVPITMNADLEDWTEDDHGGWEQLDAAQAKQLIREKRRENRNQRQATATAPKSSSAAALNAVRLGPQAGHTQQGLSSHGYAT